MEKHQTKKIFKIAVMIYLASFLIINWNDVSWIFNYREVSGLISDFFNPYPTIEASSFDAYFYPNHSQDAKQLVSAKTAFTDKQNVLEIPKLSLSVPIIFSKTQNKESIMKDLESGVIYYPGSVYPGQIGQIVILGHSAPPNWPKTKYEWVFSDLEQLEIGDKVMIDLNNRQYTYEVKQKTIIKRGAEVPADESAKNSNVLTLISCWPPGKDYQRIAVETELLSE